MARVDWPRALAWRLRRQRLTELAAPTEITTVTARLCGLHAQLSSSAELSLWARIDGLDRDAVRHALWSRRELVKLWAMRGTLHLLPAAELGLWLGALGTYRGYGNTDPAVIELAETVGKALDGVLLTREELAEEVALRTGSAATAELIRGSWGLYLKPVSFQGKLCFGPGTDQRVRFTSPASWVPGGVTVMAGEEALADVVRRYLGAFGPATPEDLGRWWGMSPGWARRRLAALGGEVVTVEVDGVAHVMLSEHVSELVATPVADTVRLLPAFDQWVVGASRTAAAMLDPAHRSKVYRAQGWMSPVLLINGRMSGVWRHRRSGRRLLVEVTPFDPVPGWVRGKTEAEAARLAAFLGGTLDLRWLG